VCVASLSLKMWTGPESVMRVLEYVGLVQNVEPENEHYHYVMRTVFCLFVSLQMCRLMNFWLEVFCSIIYHEMVYLFSKSTVMLAQIVVGISESPPALPMSDEPQADLDPAAVETDTPPPLPPPVTPSFLPYAMSGKLKRLVKKTNEQIKRRLRGSVTESDWDDSDCEMDSSEVISSFFSGPPPVLPMSGEYQADMGPVDVPRETPPPLSLRRSVTGIRSAVAGSESDWDDSDSDTD